MTDKLLDIIKSEYTLSDIDVGEFSSIKANGMKFDIRAYYAKGLGHVSVMKASGFFGLMKMDTLIINPKEKDLPLYSYDRIFAMGNDTLIVELYDTMAGELDVKMMNDVKEEYSHLAERDPGKHWYDDIKLDVSISKKGKKKDREEFDSFTIKHFEAYLDSLVANGGNLSSKLEKSAYYVNGLLEKGGPSTDVFKKFLGIDKTAKLFHEILFGIE